ncbi:6388_t:CDS:2, partial [Funneliformis geosporum]
SAVLVVVSNIGDSNGNGFISSLMITKKANLSNTEILRLSPTFSEHTQSDTKWSMPIPVSKSQNKIIQNEDIEMEENQILDNQQIE